MRLGRWLAALTPLLLSTTALAQTAPPSSPADMGITKTTLPEVLQVLDSTRTWVPIGNVDPTLHKFTLIGGATAPSLGIVNVADIGMVPVQTTPGFDSAPLVPNLMAALGPPPPFGNSGAYEVIIPGIPGLAVTTYYMSQPFVLGRAATYKCVSPTGGAVSVDFGPGDGFVQAAGGRVEGCFSYSAGYGNGTANPLTNTLTGAARPGIGVPIPAWGVGDGIVASYFMAGNSPKAFPVFPLGTVVTSFDGSGNPIFSNPPNPYGSKGATKSVATFSETGTNNFVVGDTIKVGPTTYTFAANAGVTAYTVTVGPDFPTSAANLVAAIMNTPGQMVTYHPSTSGADYNSPNQDISAATVPGSGVITFTSRYGGPIANTFPSVYTPSGTAAGSFSGATFAGADDATTCPLPCTNLNQTVFSWILPAAQALHYITAVGNSWITWIPNAPTSPYYLYNGDIVVADAYPFGSTVNQPRSASLFIETGSNNFLNGDQITVGNNTFTFRTALTAAAGDILLGPDFPTSSAHLSEGIANSPAGDRGVIFNPPTNVSNVSLINAIGPTWLPFYGTTFQSSTTDAYPSVYTPAGIAAGHFVSPTFATYRSVNLGSAAAAAIATATHAPGAEAPIWVMPTGFKRRVAGETIHNNWSRWPIGMSMVCSSGYGLNCDLSRDTDNYHQLDIVGRWAQGNNYASSSSYDEQYSDNFLADDLELGTLGEGLFNPNFESTESGTSNYGMLMYCQSQNTTSLYAGYIGGGNMCDDPNFIFPGQPGGGPNAYGLNAGGVNGGNVFGGGISNQRGVAFTGSGNDASAVVNKGINFTIGSVVGNSPTAFSFTQGGLTSWQLYWNYAEGDWRWGDPPTGNTAMDFLNSASYTGYQGNSSFAVGFPNGAIFGGDGNSGFTTTARLFGLASAKPNGNWHRNGDTEVNTGTSNGPGGMLGWYSAGGSSSFVGILNGTTLTIQQEIDPTPLPTVQAGGSGYASGANVSGTLTGTFAGCTTEPVLAVSANGTTGAITSVNSVTTRGVCPSVPSSAPWTPGGALLAGTGVVINTNWQQAGQTGAMGLNQLLTGAGVTAGTKVTAGSGNVWTVNQTYGSPIGPETITGSSWYPFGPISNDPTVPDYTVTTIRSGSSANKDIAGRVTLSGGTAVYNLTGAYLTAPICLTQDATTPANANSVVETTTTLTFTGTGSDIIKYECVGRN